MSRQIEEHVIVEFSSQLDHIHQQINARLKPFSTMKTMKGEEMAYDGLGDVEFTEVTSTINPVVFSDIEARRRRLLSRSFYVAIPIPKGKAEQVLLEPNSEFAKAIGAGANRLWDRVGIEAAFADVDTGKKFGTTLTFAQDNGNTVTATGGMTYADILTINKFWTDNEIGNDMPVRKAFLITGDEEEDLMGETEITSGDFSRQYAVDKGMLTHVSDLEIVKYGASVNNPLLSVSSGVRDCIALVEGALCYGIQSDFSIEVKDRPDLVGVEQLCAEIRLGAVRTDGKRIQKVQTTD